VYVELVEELHEFIPRGRWTLEIERARFAESVVRELYESLMLEWSIEPARSRRDT
jgi:hypothetical protein